MMLRWARYFLYACVVIVWGGLLFIVAETIRLKNTGFENKTLWDWMELFIIPLFLAIGAFYLNRTEHAVGHQIAEDRARLEREIAADRQEEAALQSYLDKMSELLLKEKLRTSEAEEVRSIAGTQTLNILRRLGPSRKGTVLLFLHEAGLISHGLEPDPKNGVVSLGDADLSKAHLAETVLNHSFLARANLNDANLSKAYLMNAFMIGTKLNGANLVESVLVGAEMKGADLSGADLTNANLSDSKLTEAILRDAKLIGANFTNADLGGVDFTGADISGADFSGANLGLSSPFYSDLNWAPTAAKVKGEQLATAKSLSGAIMPDGTLHD